MGRTVDAMLVRSCQCVRSLMRLSSSANLVRTASRSQQVRQLVLGGAPALQSRFLLRSSSQESLLVGQNKYGNRFAKNLCTVQAPLCNMIVTAAPELLGPLTEGAGLDTDIGDDDDEMSGVRKAKHRRRQKY